MTIDYQEQRRIFRGIELDCACKVSLLSPTIRLEWNSRFTRRMGDALVTGPSAGLIRLSRPLWPHATPAKRRNTMIHEIAHIYADLEKRRSGHGPRWKKYMRLFGIAEPERCYTVNAENFTDTAAVKIKGRRQARYSFVCLCGKVISFSKGTRTKWIRRQGIRHCLACGAWLSWKLAVKATLVVTK